MERGKRLIVLLLALAMVLTYMPAVAFAEPGDVNEPEKVQEVVENETPAPAEEAGNSQSSGEEGQKVDEGNNDEVITDKPSGKLKLFSSGDDSGLKAAATTGVLNITNRTGDKIKVVGTQKGASSQGFNKVMADGESKDYIKDYKTLDCINAIYANKVITFENMGPGPAIYSEATLVENDNDGYAYRITFNTPIKCDETTKMDFDVVASTTHFLVHFESNGGSGKMAAQKVQKKNGTPLSANAFSYNAKSFVGWSTSSDGSVDYKDKGSISTDHDVTLYALWDHAHDWNVQVSGDTVTVKCVNEDCNYTTNKEYTATLDATDKPYTGSAITASITKSEGFPSEIAIGDIVYTQGGSTVEPVNAGTYKATATVGASGSKKIEKFFTIKPADPTVVKPVAKNLIYNGEEQELVEKGSVENEGLKMQYSLDGKNYYDAVPTGMNVNTPYTVYYKVDGGDNYKTVEGTVPVSIAPAEFSKAPEAEENLVYNGAPQQLLKSGGTLVPGTQGEVWFWFGDDTAHAVDSYADLKAEDAKIYTIHYAAFNGNKRLTVPVEMLIEIKKAEPEFTAPEAIEGLVYNGSAQAVVTPGSTKDGTIFFASGAKAPEADSQAWSTTVPKGTDAGTGTVWYKVVGDGNHSSTEPVAIPVSIAPKAVDVTWKDDPVFYVARENKPEAAAKNPYSGGNLIVNVSEGGTNVGTYTVKASFENKNFVPSDKTAEKTYEIIPRKAVLAWEQDQELTYDGTPKLPTEPKVTGNVYSGDKCNVSELKIYKIAEKDKFDPETAVRVDEAVDAGYYAAFVRLDNPNYVSYDARYPKDISKMQLGFFSITKAPLVASVSIEGWTYDKYDAKKNAPVVAGNVEGTEVTFTYKGKTNGNVDYPESAAVPKEAGEYTVTATIAEGVNHAGAEVESEEFTVARAKLVPEKLPVANNLRYTGEAQDLIALGEAGHGLTMEYWDPTIEKWITTSPKGTDAKEYAVQYLVRQSNNYEQLQVDLPVTIKKAFPEYTAPTAKADLVYNGQAQPVLNAGEVTSSGCKFVYAYDEKDFDDPEKVIDDIKDLTLTGSVDKKLVSYVWYKVVCENENGNYYDSKPKYVRVVIDRLNVTPPVAANVTYNGKNQPLLTSGATTNSKDEKVKVAYEVDNIKVDTIPVAAGNKETATKYEIKYWAEYVDGQDITVLTEPKTVTANIVPAGVTPPTPLNPVYNGTDQPLITAGSATGGTMLYRKGKNGTYSEEIPTGRKADDFNIYYKVVNKEDHTIVIVDEAVMVASIRRADIKAGVTIEGWTYGSYDAEVNAPKLTEGSNPGGAEPTFSYARYQRGKKYSELNYEETVPTNVGAYVVKAEVPETDNYNGDTAYDRFEISKAYANPELLVNSWTYGSYRKDHHGPLVVKLPDTEKDNAKIEYLFAEIGPDEKVEDVDPARFKEADPADLDAGRYATAADITGMVNYRDMRTAAEVFEVAKATPSLTVSIGEWAYREDPKTPEVSGVIDEAPVTFLYEGTTYGEEAYSSDRAPTQAGEYTVTATAAATKNTNEASSNTVGFTVARASGQKVYIEPTAADLSYNGEDQTLLARKGRSHTGDVVYGLGTKDEAPAAYSTEVPTGKEVGTYYVWYKVEQNDNWLASDAACLEVTIEAGVLDLKVKIDDWTYGDTETPDPVVTGQYEGEVPVITYYGTANDGTKYEESSIKPVLAGRYTVKAVVEKTDNHSKAEAKAAFTIKKADLTVTAVDKTISFGDDAPALELAAEGLKNGDTVESLGKVSYRMGEFRTRLFPPSIIFDKYEAGDDTGNYQIRLGEIENTSNYDITRVNGTLKVTRRHLTVTWPATTSFEYDGKEHSVEPAVSGFYGHDAEHYTVDTEGTKASDKGSYTAKVTGIKADSSRYAGRYEWDGESLECPWTIVNADPPANTVSDPPAAPADPDDDDDDEDEAEAAAEAAFNGTYAGDIPSAKSVKAKAAKKSFTVKWKKLKKKQLKSFTNVEIQYCSDGAFNRSTTAVRVVGKGKKSVKVKGLAKGSVYYVRVRNIRNAGGTKYVSAWSGVKRVKVK